MTFSVTTDVAREIVRHHERLQDWLAGTMSRTEFSTIAEPHDAGFTMIEPSGALLSRDQVLTAVHQAYGSAPLLRIDIRAVEVLASADELVVASYEEWQDNGGPPRRATVGLSDTKGWLHLHETWLNRMP